MAGVEMTMLEFPIENRMFGMDRLAKHLNELVRSGQIHDWHPGRWIDWDHTAIEIGFDTAADAQYAATVRRDWTS